MSDASFLKELDLVIAARQAGNRSGSYTRKLLDAGPAAAARKVGEEAVEVVVAALAEAPDQLEEEAADLIYHLLVLLRAKGSDLGRVESVLRARHEGGGS